MPSLTPDQERRIDRLLKEHSIAFLNELGPEEWPDCHRSMREDLNNLGQTKFHEYAVDQRVADDEPWTLEVKKIAGQVVERAKRCRGRNEDTWRAACESIIFARMCAEVACLKCRKRLWRSEIEARPENDSRASEFLRHRQEAREPCRCSRDERPHDYQEAVGINRIFGHRESEIVRVESTAATKLEKKFLKPDKVFGLRQTRNIENLLFDTGKFGFEPQMNGQSLQVNDLITQPLSQTGDALLFPFIVLEAKSGINGADWHSVHLQTAFPIRTFLKTQHELRDLTMDIAHQPLNPLVWFLCNKGEDWKLSLAFTHGSSPETDSSHTFGCKVVDVWRGSIVTLDGALQLLLIIGYMFDWARDIYRQNIINHLRLVASGENDAATVLCTDTDIFSTRHVYEYEINFVQEDHEYDTYLKSFSVQRGPNELQCRSARWVQSKFFAVVVTRDNLQTFLDSYPPILDLNKKHQMVLLECVGKSLHLTGATINAVEKQWTGHLGRMNSPSFNITNFSAVISYATYLGEDWQVIRELNILAFEDDEVVWEKMIGMTPDPVRPSENSVLNAVQRLQAGSNSSILMSAINRRCVSLKPQPVIDLTSSPLGSPQPQTRRRHGDVPLTSAIDTGDARWCAHEIYKYFKRGSIEPHEPFLRVSSRVDRPDTMNSGSSSFNHLEQTSLEVSGHGCLWISAYGPRIQDPTPRMCLYFVDRNPARLDRKEREDCGISTFETHDVYNTIRSDWAAQKHRQFSDGCPWNLQGTYGVHVRASMNLPVLLDGRSPKHQGSKHQPYRGDGRFMYKRNMTPYIDPRETLPDPIELLFLQYKIFTDGLCYWREIAEDQSRNGVRCCPICAFDGEDQICEVCNAALNDPERPPWFRPAIRASKAPERAKSESLSDQETQPKRDSPKRKNIEVAQEEKYLSAFEKLQDYEPLDTPLEDVSDLGRQVKDLRHWIHTGEVKQTTKRRRRFY